MFIYINPNPKPMNEIKKTLFSNLLLIIGVLILTVSAFFIGKSAANIDELRSITGFAVKEAKQEDSAPEFSTYTKSVCYNATKRQFCHDVLYARCQGKEYQLPINITAQVEIPKVIIPNNTKPKKANNSNLGSPKK